MPVSRKTTRIPGVPHDPRGRDRSIVRRAGPFFLTVTSRAATARQIVARLAGVPSASFSSAKVRGAHSAPRGRGVGRSGPPRSGRRGSGAKPRLARSAARADP